MNAARQSFSLSNPEQEPCSRISRFENWTVHEYDSLSSTSLVAANLAPWTAVRADTQTAGRGRFQRSWISDAGGLWLSAVVPCPVEASTRQVLPLVVGLGVFEALQVLGVPQLRMRWPNDLLAGSRKLAGLLLDQFTPGLAVAGIGINVHNQPEHHAPELRNQVTRLADWLSPTPEVPNLVKPILRQLRRVLQDLELDGPKALLPRINRLWGEPRQVELDLQGCSRRGLFSNVDEQGRLILSDDTGGPVAYPAHRVRHLTEI